MELERIYYGDVMTVCGKHTTERLVLYEKVAKTKKQIFTAIGGLEDEVKDILYDQMELGDIYEQSVEPLNALKLNEYIIEIMNDDIEFLWLTIGSNN